MSRSTVRNGTVGGSAYADDGAHLPRTRIGEAHRKGTPLDASKKESALFQYDGAIIARFPVIRGGIIHATGLRNGPAPAGLTAEYAAQQRETADRLVQQPIAEIPSIAAWRRIFSAFGTKPTQHRNAAESLLRRLDKQGDIPSVNTLVDLGNLVAIRCALPVAVLDLAELVPPVTVRFADGTERFTNLGQDVPDTPDAGEVIFVDANGTVVARRWCWRQSAESATRPETTAALITIEGHHETAAEDVAAATADVLALLRSYQSGSQTRSWQLSANAPWTNGVPATIR